MVNPINNNANSTASTELVSNGNVQIIVDSNNPFPKDILVLFFRFLPDLRDICNASLVCRAWRQAANDNCLWKFLLARDSDMSKAEISALPDAKKAYVNDYVRGLQNIRKGIYARTMIRTVSKPASCTFIDKNKMAVGFNDGSIQIFDFETNERIALNNQGGSIKPVRVLLSFNNWQSLISGSEFGQLTLWDLEANAQKKILDVNDMCVDNLVLSEDEKFLTISSKSYRKIQVIDMQSFEFKTFEPKDGEAYFLPVNNETFISCVGQKIHVWQVEAGERKNIRTFGKETDSSSDFEHVFLSKNGKHLITVGDTTDIWDIATGECEKTFPSLTPNKNAHSFPKKPVILSENEKWLINFSDSTFEIQDLSSGNFLHIHDAQFSKGARPLAFKDGKFVVADWGARSAIHIYDFSASIDTILEKIAYGYAMQPTLFVGEKEMLASQFARLPKDVKEKICAELEKIISKSGWNNVLLGEAAFKSDSPFFDNAPFDATLAHAIYNYLGIPSILSADGDQIFFPSATDDSESTEVNDSFVVDVTEEGNEESFVEEIPGSEIENISEETPPSEEAPSFFTDGGKAE